MRDQHYSSESSNTRFSIVLTLLWIILLVRLWPNVSWFTPGSAGRFSTLLWVLTFGAAYLGWRYRIWPVFVGGVGLMSLRIASAYADMRGG